MAAIKIIDIPKVLLPVITTTKNAKVWLNGNIVKEIFIFRDTFRITTNRREYRYSLDTDMEIDII